MEWGGDEEQVYPPGLPEQEETGSMQHLTAPADSEDMRPSDTEEREEADILRAVNKCTCWHAERTVMGVEGGSDPDQTRFTESQRERTTAAESRISDLGDQLPPPFLGSLSPLLDLLKPRICKLKILKTAFSGIKSA